MATLQELLQKAESYQQKNSAVQPFTAEKSKYLYNNIRAAFIFSSNSLEGNTLSLSETITLLEDGIVGGGHSLKDCYETVGHGAAYDFMIALATQESLGINSETADTLHRLIYEKNDSQHAGRYRVTPCAISSVEFVPPDSEDIPRLMNHLADQIHSSRSTLHPIELAAMAHKRLLDIQPFSDGNGLVARLMMNLILVHAGYCVVSIPTIRRNDYRQALAISRRTNDMDPFSKFIAECTIESFQECRQLL